MTGLCLHAMRRWRGFVRERADGYRPEAAIRKSIKAITENEHDCPSALAPQRSLTAVGPVARHP